MQIIVNGIVQGSLIAVLALAFAVVYVPTRIFHLALGGIFALVPFLALSGLQRSWPWYVAAALSLLFAIALSVGIDYVSHAPLVRRGAAGGAHLIASLGTYIVIVQAIALVWGNDPKVLRTGADQVIPMGTLALTRSQILGATVSFLLIGLFYVLLRWTDLGLKFRALADNPPELALRGYNLRSLTRLGFGLSGLLGGASALLLAYDTGFDPQGGLPVLLLAVVGVIVGGRRSFLGPVLGGLLVCIIRSEAAWFFSAQWQDALIFLLLAVVLLVRPQGLVGQRFRLEAGS